MSAGRSGRPSPGTSASQSAGRTTARRFGRPKCRRAVRPAQESCYLGGHRQGGAHITRCTHKAVHTKGGLWPPQESCYLGGHRQGGTHITRCTHKAVHTKGGLWPPQESCYFTGHRQGGTHNNAVRPQGGAHTRWSVATAGVMLFKGPQGGGGVAFSRGTWGGGCIGTSRQFGQPDRRPAVSAGFSAEIFGGGLGRPISAGRTAARRFGRPTPPLATSLSAEPHRRRASPPFHSELPGWVSCTCRVMTGWFSYCIGPNVDPHTVKLGPCPSTPEGLVN